MPQSEDGRRGDGLQPQNKSGFFEIRGSRGAVLQPLRLDVARAGFDDRATMDSLPDSSATTPTDWLLRVGRLTDTAEDLLGGLCELLMARGLPLERVGIHGRVLHPQVAGIRFRLPTSCMYFANTIVLCGSTPMRTCGSDSILTRSSAPSFCSFVISR